MAIAFDAASSSSATSTSLTFAHTCSGGSRILMLGIQTGSDGGAADITGVTYGGVAMTQLNVQALTSNNDHLYLYYLIAPNTGANNIVVNKTNSGFIAGFAASYNGVKQSSQPEAQIAGNGSTNPTLNLTTLTDNAWIVGAATCSSGTLTITSGTVRAGTTRIIGDRGPYTPAGSKSFQVNDTASETVWVNLAAIGPVVIDEDETVTTTDSATATLGYVTNATETVTVTEDESVKYGFSSKRKSSNPTWINKPKS